MMVGFRLADEFSDRKLPVCCRPFSAFSLRAGHGKSDAHVFGMLWDSKTPRGSGHAGNRYSSDGGRDIGRFELVVLVLPSH